MEVLDLENTNFQTYYDACVKQAKKLIDSELSGLIVSGSDICLRITGSLFEEAGYAVHTLNLDDMQHSEHYNPLAAVHTETDIHEVCCRILKIMDKDLVQPPQRSEAERLLFESILLYLFRFQRRENFNIPMAMKLLDKENKKGGSIKRIFDEVEKYDDMDCAYVMFNTAAAYGAGLNPPASASLAAKLSLFCLPVFSELTSGDDMEMESIGDKKVAYFIIRPSNSAFRFLTNLFTADLNSYIQDNPIWKGEVLEDEYLPVRAFGSFEEWPEGEEKEGDVPEYTPPLLNTGKEKIFNKGSDPDDDMLKKVSEHAFAKRAAAVMQEAQKVLNPFEDNSGEEE